MKLKKCQTKRKTAKGIQHRQDELQFLTFYTILIHLHLQHTIILFFFIISQIPTPHLLKSIHLNLLLPQLHHQKPEMPTSTMSQTKIDTKNLQLVNQNFNMAQPFTALCQRASSLSVSELVDTTSTSLPANHMTCFHALLTFFTHLY